MGEFRLLSKREVFGNNRLDIFKKISRACMATSFAEVLTRSDSTSWWLSSTFFEIDDWEFYKRICIANYKGNLDYSYDSDDGCIKIRPVMKYSNLQQFETSMQTNDDGVIEVEYGEYPQEKVSGELKKNLEECYVSKQGIRETGKKYTIAFGYVDDNKEAVPPKQLIEYEFEGKKYVRIHTYDRPVWIEVSPIKWYVDETKKILISKKSLIGDFSHKDIPKFLNTYFAEEIIVKKPKKEEEKKTDTNEKKEDLVSSNEELSSIERLINEIYKYLDGNPNKDTIIEKLVKMTNDYNSKLDQLSLINENDVPTLESYEGISSGFELELNMLLEEVKRHHEKYKEYFDMLRVLDKYIELINGNKDTEYTDGVVPDLNIIMDVCLPFLKEKDADKVKQMLIGVMNRQKKEIINYINDDTTLIYKTMDEMTLNLRAKIHPILNELSTFVNKRDIELEITTAIEQIINGLYKEPENKLLTFMLDQINLTYSNINNLIDELPPRLQSKYKLAALDIMRDEIDYSKDFNMVSNALKIKWLSLNKVLYRMTDYLERNQRIKSGHISIDMVKK